MLKNSPQGPIFTAIPPKHCWSFVRTCNNIDPYFGGGREGWPDPIKELRSSEKDLAIQALGLAIAFL